MSNSASAPFVRARAIFAGLTLALLPPATASSAPHNGQLYLDYAEVPLITQHPGAYSWMVIQSYMRVHVDIPRLKAANPGMRLYMYFDTAGAYDLPPAEEPWPSGMSYRWVKANHPDWIVKDRSGRPVTFWGGDLHLYDVGNKAYQDEWARRAIDYAKTGGFHGVFADDVNMGESFRSSWSAIPSKYPTDLAWTQAVESFLKNVSPQLEAAGLALMPNVASAWNSDRPTQVRWAKLAGAYAREHYESWPSGDAPGEDDIDKGLLGGADWAWMASLHRDIAQAGVGFYAFPHAGGWQAIDKMRYTSASFLLWHDPGAAGGGYAYATGGGADTGQDPYNSAWTFDLGAPSAAAVQQSPGVWTRRFARGSVRVDSNAKTASVLP